MEIYVGTEEYHLPIFHATYDPFGSINEDFDSTGIVVGNNNDTKITWTVPFRFPGQYQDPELEGVIFYNWNRYYSPAIGRYNRADPAGKLIVFPNTSAESKKSIFIVPQLTLFPSYFHTYKYAFNNPISLYDYTGLTTCPSGTHKVISHDIGAILRCFGSPTDPDHASHSNFVNAGLWGMGCIVFISISLETGGTFALLTGGAGLTACGVSGFIIGHCLGEGKRYSCVSDCDYKRDGPQGPQGPQGPGYDSWFPKGWH